MFSSRKVAMLMILVMLAPIVLAACGPTPEPEVIVETVVVEQTKVVEKEGEKVTVIETVQVEVTSPPEPTLGDLVVMRLAMVRNRLRSLGLAGWLKLSGLMVLTVGFMVGEGVLAHVLFSSVRSKEDLSALFVLSLLQQRY